MTAAIETEGLRKVYPATGGSGSSSGGSWPPLAGSQPRGSGETVALEGLDLVVNEGEFFGLIGPNGAGKTTTIGVLTTRVLPTGGVARVAGADVVQHGVTVRQRIGVVPQRPNPDRSLDSWENLIYHAAYFGVPGKEAARRATGLLERLEIADKARMKVDQLSGGQQQRLMIARALIHEPTILFLDEPTVGLDPNARNSLWEILRDLHRQGRTIVMTTHYMPEADELSDRIALIDRGRLLALDTPENLKKQTPDGSLETFFIAKSGRRSDA
ncbi:MAG TPA: ATP-binding cassette domain-containing protein [Gemmatimonadaceae bacterium]